MIRRSRRNTPRSLYTCVHTLYIVTPWHTTSKLCFKNVNLFYFLLTTLVREWMKPFTATIHGTVTKNTITTGKKLVAGSNAFVLKLPDIKLNFKKKQTNHILITEVMQSPPSVRLSVRPFVSTIFETDWPLTLNFCVWVGYDHISQGINGQGNRSRSRSMSWVRLIRSVGPTSMFFLVLPVRLTNALLLLRYLTKYEKKHENSIFLLKCCYYWNFDKSLLDFSIMLILFAGDCSRCILYDIVFMNRICIGPRLLMCHL